ncbi:hypothetical protein FYJ43_00185 [Cutibacterium sp. WCA-380-WT-3A]|uniref:Lipoprotein n=1 Tax=Cutibacterium porci TaxID=2605781 RepID=A0A7K0J3K8_9ACTN|nr:hypothetical protein [Cutibacterium porci]MSS44506.1 hypothetical protein [Cutibacterium porci]
MVMNGKGARRCRRRVAMVASLVVAGLGVAACGTSGNSSDATGGITPVARATSTHRSTPPPSAQTPKVVKVSATPVPGTKQDALFLEAKQVYETYLEQTLLFEQEGGGKNLPLGLESVVGGVWQEMISEYYEKVKERGHIVRPESAGYGFVNIGRRADREGHEIAINSCVDQRGWEFIDSEGNVVSRGIIKHNEVFLDHVAGRMVIVDGLSERVSKCES